MILIHAYPSPHGPITAPVNSTNPLHPKTYPFWEELVVELEKIQPVVQLVRAGDKDLVADVRRTYSPVDMAELMTQCSCWVSIDTFIPKFSRFFNKRGVVIFGPTDPLVFGFPENINLLKDRSYIRPDPDAPWGDDEVNDPEKFVSVDVVVNAVKELLA